MSKHESQVEVHLADNHKLRVPGTLGEVQSKLTTADVWSVLEDASGTRVAVRPDQVVYLKELRRSGVMVA